MKSLKEEVLEKRYFFKDENGKIKENWNDLCNRVSEAVSFNPIEEKQFFDAMHNCDFLPNSPVLMNAGNSEKFTMSACFVIDIKDTMKSIFEAVKQSALISKMGGGCGYDFSILRPENSRVGSTDGVASGPLSFIEVFDKATDTIKQGGKRRGANMAVMRVDHPDIEKFIDAKLTDGHYSNFNFSVAITDEFMKAVKEDKTFQLKFNHKQFKIIKAKDLWNKICENAWKNGEPGVIFINKINEKNVLKEVCGDISATNPCLTGDSLLLDNDCLKRIDRGNSGTYTTWKSGNKKVIKLVLNNGMSLGCTSDHKIMLDNGEFVEAKETLNKSITWGLGNRESKKINYDYLLMGFIFGDGYICSKGQGISVKLNKNKEKEVHKLLHDYGFTFTNKDCVSYDVYYRNKTEIESDTEINFNFLNQRVWDRDLPDEILYGDSTVVKSFLRGLFEANGSCNINNQVSLKGTCKSMIEKVQILLASFGIPSWISVNKPKSVEWKNGIYTSRESYNLQLAPRNSNLFKNKIGFHSGYKNNKVKELNGKYNTKLKVINITDEGYRDVYDFNMNEGNHYNFCNGLIVHNCGELFASV